MPVQATRSYPAAAVHSSARTEGSAPARGNLSGAAKEFESILLNQWLQAAESTFGDAPGGSESDDPNGDQMKSFATQQLATTMATRGALGVGRFVQSELQRTEGKAASSHPPSSTTLSAAQATTRRHREAVGRNLRHE